MPDYTVRVLDVISRQTLSLTVEAAAPEDALREALNAARRDYGLLSPCSHPDLVHEVRYTCLTCGRELANREAYFCPPCLVWAMRKQMARQEVA